MHIFLLHDCEASKFIFSFKKYIFLDISKLKEENIQTFIFHLQSSSCYYDNVRETN